MVAHRAELIHALIDIFCILYAAVILRRTNNNVGNEIEVKYYKGLIWCFIGFAASNVYWLFPLVYLGDLPMLILNAINISFMLGIVVFWSTYAEIRLIGRDRAVPLWTIMIIQIPLAILIVLCWISIHTGTMFYVEGGELYQGRFYIALIITIGLLFILISTHAAREASATSSKSRKRECLTIILFAVMPLIAGVLDSFLPNLPLMTPSVFFSILLIFTDQQNANIFNDSLTGMYNRRYALDYLDEAVKSADKSPFYLILLDARKFGNINDIYGHIQGDKVLQVMARALEGYSKENDCFCARWGGDDFLVIIDKDKCTDPDEVVQKLNRIVKEGIRGGEVHIEVAFDGGYCLCDSSAMSTDDVLNQAEDMVEKTKSAAA